MNDQVKYIKSILKDTTELATHAMASHSRACASPFRGPCLLLGEAA